MSIPGWDNGCFQRYFLRTETQTQIVVYDRHVILGLPVRASTSCGTKPKTKARHEDLPPSTDSGPSGYGQVSGFLTLIRLTLLDWAKGS